jgi:hypothetical protein
MKTLVNIRNPDGTVETVEVNAPDDATEQEIAQALQGVAGRSPERMAQDPMLTHPERPLPREGVIRAEAARAFGLPQGQIDPSRSAGYRYGAGLATDNPQEALKFYQRMYPGAKVAPVGDVVGVQEQPGQPPMFSNPPGFEMGDIAEIAGAATPSTVGALAALPLASNPWTGALAASVGSATGEGLRELGQAAYGVQDEDLADVGLRMGIAAGGELLPLAPRAAWRGAKKGANLALGRRTGLEEFNAAELEHIAQATSEGFDIPLLKRYQTFDQDPVLQRFANQILQLSPDMQKQRVEQYNALFEAARGAIGDTESADRAVKGLMRDLYSSTRERYLPRPEEAGRVLWGAVGDALKGRKGAMQRGYDLVDRIAAKESPIFDLSASKRLAQGRTVLALPDDEAAAMQQALTEPLTADGVSALVNVAEPANRLRRVNGLLAAIDPTQTDYRVLKEIRTQVGKILDLNPVALEQGGVDVGAARTLYRQLTEDMGNVQGAPRLKDALVDANSKALRYYDSLDQEQIKAALKARDAQTPVGFFQRFANSPQQLEPAFRSALSESSGKKVNIIRKNLEQAISLSENPLATIDKWQKEAPEAYRFLYPTKEIADAARDTARKISYFTSGPYKKAYQDYSEQVGFARYALAEKAKARLPGTSLRRSMESFVDELGGVGSQGHEALRAAAWEQAFEGVFKYHSKTGSIVPDAKRLGQNIQDLKERGIWSGILTGKDKTGLRGFQAAARRMEATGDTGTGLVLAGEIGKLRNIGNPGDVVSAASSIRLSRMFARLITKDVPMDLLGQPLPKGPKRWKALNAAMSTAIEATRPAVFRFEEEPQPPASPPSAPGLPYTSGP